MKSEPIYPARILLGPGLSNVHPRVLKMHIDPEYRLPLLTVVMVPEGVDDSKVRETLLDTFNIEIGGGLGVLKGKVWRIGLMGINSSEQNALLLLDAFKRILTMER